MSAPAKVKRQIDARDLPIDIETEKNLIWCLLKKPELLRDESLVFSVEDFHLTSHKRIVQAMINLDADGIVPDRGMIETRLTDQSVKDYLFDLADGVYIVSPSNAKSYASILKRVAIKRQGISDSEKLFRAATTGEIEDIARIRAEIGKREEKEESTSSIDAADLCPAPPREHIVKDWIPRGVAIALHGPPGTGKSVFLTKMTVAVAGGLPFYGMETFPGRVMYVSNEWTDKEEVSRIWYPKTRNIKTGQLALEPSGPLLEWVSVEKSGQRKGEWVFTKKGRETLRKIEKMRPDLIIFDTILGLCSGVEQLNNAMTYSLGDLLQKEIATKFDAALILVAHTSQASSKESLTQRLNYEAMAGGNGLPGAVRMTIGLTKVRPDDFGKDVEALSKSLVAIGSSKYNVEGFRPCWTDNDPGFLAWGPTGLELESNPESAIIRKENPAKEEKGSRYATAY